MSIDQMIAELTSYDSADLDKLEFAIRSARKSQQPPTAFQLRRRLLDFEPIRIQGEPLSQTIIRDRGER